jgi:hypothetical protein
LSGEHFCNGDMHMNDPLLALKKMDEILHQARNWDFPSQLSAYSAIMHLVDKLDQYLEEWEIPGQGYLQEHTEKVRWHSGAMFGLDATNGYDAGHHYTAALGSLGILKSNLEQLRRKERI